jgi:CheY-specific phosphatase CheX
MADVRLVLAQTFSEVLERQAFMFAEPYSEPLGDSLTADYLQVTICFSGPVRGRLDLVAPKALGHGLTANILGAGDQLTFDQAQDTLKELLNVVCGQVLTSLYGTEHVIGLSIPTICRIDPEQGMGWRQHPEGVSFLIDNEIPAHLFLSLGAENP